MLTWFGLETNFGCCTANTHRRWPKFVSRLPPLEAKERIHLARLCQAAESEFVGVNCGLLDQLSCLFGRAYHVMNIDCRFQSVHHAPVPGEAMVVCDSGVKHQLAASEYNALREHCESAALALAAKSLRSVELPWLKAHRDNLNQRDGQLERVLHRQGVRFTTMLSVAIFLSISALTAVCVIGYLLMTKPH